MLRLLSRLIDPLRHTAAAATPRPLAEQMEPRLLYSADIMPVGLDAAAGMPAAEIRNLDLDTGAWLDTTAAQQGGGELLFVDAGVADADTLTRELLANRPGLEIVHIDASRDGIEQIGEALAGRSGVTAIHVISHGAAGELQLGNGTVDLAGLEARTQSLETWRQALDADADILLYGCDLAGDADGLAFIATLARLTGADVAASSDRTGSAQSGANWVLEARSGNIETGTLHSRDWLGSLALAAVSGDIKVNAVSSFEQTVPKVAMLDNGNWMSVWAADNVILIGQMIGARTFNAAGIGLSSDFAVDMSGTSITPDIATDGTSRFVVTWVSSQNGNQDIYARLFDASGSALGAAFMVTSGDSAASAGDQQDPNVAMNASGDFVVTWSGKGSDDNDGIFARRFDGSGTALGGVFTVNADTGGKQLSPDVAMNDDGRFVIAWVDEGQSKAALVRTYDASGVAGSVITVESNVADPAIAMDASGAFSLVWAENGIDSDKHAIVLQAFDAAGNSVGSRVQVNTTEPDQQERPAIAMTSQGDMVIAWESNKQDGDRLSTVLRSFTAGAATAGDEIIANTYTAGDQATPDVAINDAGQLVVVWAGERASGSGSDLGGKTFSWPEAIVPIVNTAPVLDNSSAVVLSSIDEDAPAPTGAAGWLISEIASFSGSGSGPQNVKDADADALGGIALIAADGSAGQWHYSLDGGANWILIDTTALSSANALLLAANGQTRLHYTPNANTNGTLSPALGFRAWDRTSGSNGTFADSTANGGSTAFSTAAGRATLTVNSINDLPTIVTNRLAISEGSTVTLDNTMLNAGDVETPTASLLYTVTAVSGGFFATGSAPTTPVTAFTQADIDAGRIIFTHDAGEVAPGYSLTVTDSDDATSPVSNAAITFTPVNDAPTVTGAAADMNVLRGNGPPSGAVGASVASLVSLSGSGSGPQNISDPDTGALTGMAIIAADTTNGTWHFSTDGGANWSLLGAVSGTSARLLAADGNTRLYFEHTSANTGTFANALQFQAWDRSGGINGSLADPSGGGGSSTFSGNSGYLQLNIIDVNQAPVLTPNGPIVVTAQEGAPAPASGSAAGFLISSLASIAGSGSGPQNVTDANGDSIGIALYSLTESNGTWWYTTNGGINWANVGAPSPTAALLLANDGLTRLYYQPTDPDVSGSGLDTLGFRAWDGSSGTNGGTADVTVNGTITAFSTTVETASLTVLAVNDLPVAVQGTPLAITEGQISIVSSANLAATDVETAAAGLTYTVSGLSGGFFAFGSAPGVAISGFTQADIDTGILRFVHDGSETAPAYTFSVSDGTDTIGPFAGSTSFTRVNDAPVFVGADSPVYSLDEDAGTPFGAVGIPVQEMVSLDSATSGPRNVSDPDAGGLTGIAIIAADSSHGTWYYTRDSGLMWTPLAAASPTSATLLAASTGVRLAFRPNADYNGTTPDALTFLAWDQTIGTSGGTADTTVGNAFSATSHTLTLTVRPANDPPTAVPIDLGSLAEDNALTITQSMLTAGSNDIDGDTLTAINLSLTSGSGTLIDNADGSWTFTPAANWNGNVGFAFELDDGTATVANTASLVVSAVNDAPSIIANTLVIREGQRVVLNNSMISASDVESTATALTYAVSGLAGGSFTLAGSPANPITTFTQAQIDSGSIVFTHDGGEAAPTYVLTVTDGAGDSSPASTAAITFTNTNDPPVVSTIDLGSILEDGSRTITQADLLAGASDADGDALVASGLILVSGTGSLVDNGNATWTFTPGADWNGSARFSFTVSDGSLVVANTAALVITPVNDAPVTSAIDLGNILEDGSRTITQADLLAGASDADGDALVASGLILVSGTGSLVDNGNATWTFTPGADWNGSVRFSFVVSDGSLVVANTAALVVTPVNDAPMTSAIDLGSILEDGSRTITQADLLAGASDADGDALVASSLTRVSGTGSLVDNGDTTWTFTPGADWNGSARFSFTVSDGSLIVANTAALVVTPVNDAPVTSAIDLGSILEDGSRTITQADLLAGASDTDGDALVASGLTLVSGTGSLVDNGNATWTFTPGADWNGSARFGFTVSDGSLVVANTAALVITPVNDAPVTSAIDLGSILEDGSRTITQADLLAGASDADGDALVASGLTLVSGTGSLVDNGDTTWTFTPGADWNGSARFSFTVSDGATTVGNTAALTVRPVNDAPVILINRLAITEGQTVTLSTADLDGEDIDNADTSLGYSVLSVTGGYFALADAPSTPVVQFSQMALATGSVRFVHDGSNTAPSFTLSLHDDELASAPSTAVLVFTPVNDAPSISAPGIQVIPVGSGFGPVEVRIGDEESPPAKLVVRAYSTNQSVLPDSAITLSGTGTIRSLSVVGGYGGMPGVARIVIEVSDGDKTTSTNLDVFASSVSIVDIPAPAATVEAESTAAPPPAPAAPEEAPVAPVIAPGAIENHPANTETLAEALKLDETATPVQRPPERIADEVTVVNVDRVVVAPIRVGTPEILSLLYAPAEATETTIADSAGSRDQHETRLEQVFAQLRNTADGEARSDRQEVAVAIATGTGLTIGYVAWLLRGGVLVSSLLTSMPAWRLLDPLPILGNVRADDAADDDSLESMVDTNKPQPPEPAAASRAPADATGNSPPGGGM